MEAECSFEASQEKDRQDTALTGQPYILKYSRYEILTI